MKMTVILAVGLVTAPVVTALLKSPEFIPMNAWNKLPLPEGQLSNAEVAEINRKYGQVDVHQPNPFAIQKVSLSRGLDAHISTDAGARNPATPVRPTKPLLLAQADDPAGEADPSTPTAPRPPTTPVPSVAPVAQAVQSTVDEIQHEVALAQQEAENATKEAMQAVNRAASAIGSGDYGPFMTFSDGTSSSHNLIIRSSETDPKSLVAASKDLSVMGRILSKAVGRAREDEEKTVLSVRLTSFGSGVRNIQIEGYGAIFLLRANIPLLGPPEKATEEKPREPGNSTWDETYRELYGQREAMGEMHRLGHQKESRIKYDPERVEQLENALLDAMKNADHLHSLKDGESLTVVVTSTVGGSDAWEVDTEPSGYSSGGSGGGNTYVWSASSSSSSSPNGTHGGTLTIRAKKSDIDAFAHGKLTSEEFRRKATIAVY